MTDAPLLIFDFDGTVCLGAAPVDRYCQEVCARLPEAAARRVQASYDAYRGGTLEAPDGYFAIADAIQGELPAAELTAAYLASREWLRTHPDCVAVPSGLGNFLDAARGEGAERVLLTNSPLPAVAAVLDAHGLSGRFDRVQGDAGKPAGWTRLLDDLLLGRPASLAMSVGDVWDNDARPVLEAGGAAAFIDADGLRSGPATVVASDLPSLYPDLLAWVRDPGAFVRAHPTELPGATS